MWNHDWEGVRRNKTDWTTDIKMEVINSSALQNSVCPVVHRELGMLHGSLKRNDLRHSKHKLVIVDINDLDFISVCN